MSLRELVSSVLHGPHKSRCVDDEWETTSKRLDELRSSEVDDTECLEEALREYHESTWDDRDFKELPADVKHAVLHRAQEIKELRARVHAA